MKSALEQCPLPPLPHPWSPLQIEESMYTADQMRDYARAAIAAADAALALPAAQPKPIAWAQLGTRNGHTYVRMNYEGYLYPPPPDVQRNLNLVPLYAAPPTQQPLTDEQIENAVAPLGFAQLSPVEVARAIERAHGIKGEA